MKKWEASRAKRGLNEAQKKNTTTIPQALDSMFPARQTLRNISAAQTAPRPKQTPQEARAVVQRDKERGTTISAPAKQERSVIGKLTESIPGNGLIERGIEKFVNKPAAALGNALRNDPNEYYRQAANELPKGSNEEVYKRALELRRKMDPGFTGSDLGAVQIDVEGTGGLTKKVGATITKKLLQSIVGATTQESAERVARDISPNNPAVAQRIWQDVLKAKNDAEATKVIEKAQEIATPDTGAIRDNLITRLESPVPVKDGGFRQADVLEGGEIGPRVKEVVTNLKKTPQPTVAQINEAIEALRLSGRKADDLVEELNTFTKGLPETYNQRPGAFDIAPITKTKREALEVFPDKQTPEGLAGLESRGRGQVSWEDAKKAAQNIGWSEEKMINMPIGKAFSDTEMMASRGISKNADDTLSAMEARLMTLEKGSPDYLTQAQNVAVQRLKAFKLKTVVVGASSEAGRALSSLRANVEKMDFLEKRVAKLFNDPKTPQNVKDYIEKMVSDFTGTPEQFAKLLRDTKKSSILDMMVEYATAIKLTGIPTHVVNLVSGTAMVAMRPIERAIAATINKGETLITGAKQQRFFNDAVNDVIGQTTGWRQGGREALNAILDEDYAWRSRPLEDISLQGPAIKGRVGMNEPIDVTLNVAGKVIRLPYRLLGAQDLLIREPAKMGEFYTAIGRLALDKGYTPGSREYADFFASTLNNPSAEMVEQITKAADRVTFQDELSPGFTELQNLISGNFKAVRFIVPFFKTIVNLQKRALEYSPLAPILPSVRGSLKASPETRADALARMAVGSAVITPLVFEALDGNITLESPKNPADRDAFFASGKQAYSIKVGDHWVPFNRLSPFSEWFVTAALFAKAIDNEDEKSIVELTTNTFLGLAANVFDKSFATGLADLMDALRGTDKEKENWFNNFVVGSTLPVLSGNIARTIDPTLREVNNLKEAYMARIPGLSDNINARNDVFGQPITRPGSAIERAISPVIPTPAVENAVRAELESLGITMGFPGNKPGGFEMTDEQYYDYQQIAGRATYSTLFKLISNPQFQKLPAGRREEAVNKVINEVRTTVRTQVAAEQVIMKEIQDRLEKGGLTSEQAKEKAVDVYEQLKQGNKPTQ